MKKLSPFGVEIKASNLSQLSREETLALVTEHKLLLVRGLDPFSREDLLRFASIEGGTDLVQWDFGPVMEMKVDPSKPNYLFSTERVPFHWDGAFHVEPSILVFQCVQAPDPEKGGETLFADGEAIFQNASREQRSKWKCTRLTYQTEKKAHYGGSITNSMVGEHPKKRTSLLRYAEPVHSKLNPVSLKVDGADQATLEREMEELLYSAQYCYQHRWQDNDLLLVDNFSLLHGRNAFAASSPRHLRRIQLK